MPDSESEDSTESSEGIYKTRPKEPLQSLLLECPITA